GQRKILSQLQPKRRADINEIRWSEQPGRTGVDGCRRKQWIERPERLLARTAISARDVKPETHVRMQPARAEAVARVFRQRPRVYRSPLKGPPLHDCFIVEVPCACRFPGA